MFFIKSSYVRKLFILSIFMPVYCFPQFHISMDIIERVDRRESINTNFNLSIGRYLYKDIIVGVTNEDAIADYIKDGYNPVVDSLTISDFQLFTKYYLKRNIFLTIKSPINNSDNNISIKERIRVGAGFNMYYGKEYNTDIYISYDLLLSPNQNGFRKGKFNIGIASSTRSLNRSNLGNLIESSFLTNWYASFYNWINKPITYGYKESVIGD